MEESKSGGDAPPQTRRGGTSDDREDNTGSFSYALNFEGLPTGLTTDDMRDLIRHFNDVVEVFVIRETNERGTIASAIFESKGAAQSARSAISSIGDSPTISTVGDGDNEGPSPNLMCASLQDAAAYFHKGLLTWTKIESRSQPGPKEDGGVPRATTITGTAWTGDIRHADMAAVGRSLSRVREIITTNRHIWELVTFDVLGSGALRLHKALRKAFFKHSNIKRQLDTIHERSTADSGHGLAIDIRPVDDQTETAIRTCNTCATVIRRSALGLAAESGEIGAMCVMLERGEDVNVSDPPTSAHCRTALHWAAFSNNEVVIELLVEAGASVQAVGKGHESPLHVSAERSCTGWPPPKVRWAWWYSCWTQVQIPG
ncbi:unnamed protein product [Ectocarpus fasciculatus]